MRYFTYALTTLCLGLLALAHFLAGAWLTGSLLILVEILWTLGLLRGWRWAPLLCLYATAGLAVAGFVLQLSSGLLLAGGILLLPAWDLSEFSLRLRAAAPEDDTRSLERRHLLRLGLLWLAGSGLAGAALYVPLHIPFEWTVVLIFAAVLGVGQAMKWLLGREF